MVVSGTHITVIFSNGPLREKSSGKQKYFQTPDAIKKISSIIGMLAGKHWLYGSALSREKQNYL
jgi:hypothetical protein